MSFIPTTMYYASAAINAISIPGHFFFGINEVDPAIAAIPSDEKYALGKATATTAWDMVNALLAASGEFSSATRGASNPANLYQPFSTFNGRDSESGPLKRK
jgi:hypothetical protein